MIFVFVEKTSVSQRANSVQLQVFDKCWDTLQLYSAPILSNSGTF